MILHATSGSSRAQARDPVGVSATDQARDFDQEITDGSAARSPCFTRCSWCGSAGSPARTERALDLIELLVQSRLIKILPDLVLVHGLELEQESDLLQGPPRIVA